MDEGNTKPAQSLREFAAECSSVIGVSGECEFNRARLLARSDDVR